MRILRGVAVPAALAGVLALSGCTPPLYGDIGLSLDGEGNVVASIQICDEAAGSVIAFFEPNSGSTDEERLAEWEFDNPVTDFDTIEIGDVDSLESLAESHTVYIRAVAQNGDTRTGVIELTPELIESLGPDTISDTESSVSVEDFRADTCTSLGYGSL